MTNDIKPVINQITTTINPIHYTGNILQYTITRLKMPPHFWNTILKNQQTTDMDTYWYTS